MQIKIKKIENGKLPEYKTEGSAGADCYARIKKEIVIAPGVTETIPLGFAVEIPVGYEMQIRGRSGLAKKNSIDCFPGTIDSDYRGEVCAIIINKGSDYFRVRPFDRIAQAVIAPVIKAEWRLTDNLSETERGAGGFGSTGVSVENKKTIGIEVEANLSMTEKFYEPFTKMNELEELLGKEVIVDRAYKATFTRMYHYGIALYVCFKVTGATRPDVDLSSVFSHDVEMNSATAFERVTIDGHRFGKEIEFEG